MWMANLLVAIIVLGFVAYQYFKGTVVKSFAIFISAIFASILAFNYFEILAKSLGGIEFLADYLGKDGAVGWLQSVALLVIFGLSFIIFLTIVQQLAGKKVEIGLWPERVGRVFFGALGGIMISGVVITALMLAPLANGKPYQRFNPRDVSETNKVLLNADGIATGLFGKISSISLSGDRSFSVVHANFLDQVALSSLYLEKDKTSLSLFNEITLPKKIAAWPAGDKLEYKESEDSEKMILEPKNGKKILIVHVGVKLLTKKENNVLTMSQMRLICKSTSSNEEPFAGNGENIYPIGYMTKNILLKTPLSYAIALEGKDNIAWINFVFELPTDLEPVAVELKRTSIAELPAKAIAKEPLTPAMIKDLDKNEGETN